MLNGIIVLGCLIFIGRSNQNKTSNKVKTDGAVHKDEGFKSKEKRIAINSDIAESINYYNKSIYIRGLKMFDEFGTSNEGRVIIDEDENTLKFEMIKSTGTVTGAISGPRVCFKLNLDTNEIIENNFVPAPDYEKLGKTEFIEHSNEIIELSDERIIEIGKYFNKFLTDIISNQ